MSKYKEGNQASRAQRAYDEQQDLPPALTPPIIPEVEDPISSGMYSILEVTPLFHGLASEDPIWHLEHFMDICDFINCPGVAPESLLFKLFPHTLKDDAREWYYSRPVHEMLTWQNMQRAFLGEYFPPAKSAELRAQIYSFVQDEGESLSDAWERFTGLLLKCPNHGLMPDSQIEAFYFGLEPYLRMILDAAANGSLLGKPYKEAVELIETFSRNDYQYRKEPRPIKCRNRGDQVDDNRCSGGFTRKNQSPIPYSLVQQLESLRSKIDAFLSPEFDLGQQRQEVHRSSETVRNIETQVQQLTRSLTGDKWDPFQHTRFYN